MTEYLWVATELVRLEASIATEDFWVAIELAKTRENYVATK